MGGVVRALADFLLWVYGVVFGPRYLKAYIGVHGDSAPPQSPGQMSPEGLPGLDSGGYLSASATGEAVVQCACGTRVLLSARCRRCPACGRGFADLLAF